MAPKYAKDQPAGFVNRIEKVAVIGAGGQVGKWIAEALVKTGKHTVTGITRADSTSQLPAGVVPAKVNYDDEASLVEALKGQQFLVITLSVFVAPDTHSKLVKAAAKAGVPYVLPNFWGYDPFDDELSEQIGFGKRFIEFREEIEALGVSTWIAMACGFWYEFSLAGSADRFGFDFKERSVVFIDDGNFKINTSTFAQTGQAVAAFLSLKLYPDDADDKSPAISNWDKNCFYISSFLVSQRDMFESVKRVTGTTDADWKITTEKSQERYANGIAAMQKGDMAGFARMMYTRIFFPEGNSTYEKTKGLQNDVLGLPKEDIDEATKEAVRQALEA
ncbi:putative oxidoreductase CipA [Cryphonectria parasitica EP155]|uniref:Oxidoreductase CipA n=1 Tax=Cryphonectria parasitica (strain ATCC 38755 / EP155) TaxID=660469 RepID=A0A9P5CK72_CRYP1|nr:putative oxidoreductase CipA [Cryphonectria parasitica EP155]KAF3761974.1 putative oxidoreductase CipA [Cryphonectria parasitica EP155]